MPRLLAAESCVLDLLASDADFEEIAAYVRGRQARASDADRRALEAMLTAAEELYRSRASAREQLYGLALLNETADDLAGLLESDRVLGAICRRARLLLGTDVAYITLIDMVRGDTYVHATDGVVSEEFRAMRIALGVGLGGLVARDGEPAVTSDYETDERFAHTRDVDARVQTEGLRAIAGVPLRRRNEVIGVLMSASRTVRRFDAREITLFEGMASHAAIAIENARLFERARRSLAALKRLNESMERGATLHARLVSLALEGAEPTAFGEAIAETLGGDAILVVEDMPGAVGEPEGDQDTVVVPVSVSGEHLGEIRWRPPAGSDIPREQQLMERCAMIIAGHLLSRRARTDVDYRRRADFVRALFEDRNVSDVRLSADAGRLGVALTEPLIVIEAELPDGGRRWDSLFAARGAAGARGAVRLADGTLTAVLAGDDPRTVGETWAALLRAPDGQTPAIGVSTPAQGLVALRRAHGEATAALRLAKALGRPGATAFAAELGIFAMAFARAEPHEIDEFLERVVGPVVAADEERREGGALLCTLEFYLDHSERVRDTARALGIHVNTLYQRLARIDDLLGDWRSPDRRLELSFALRLARIRGMTTQAVVDGV